MLSASLPFERKQKERTDSNRTYLHKVKETGPSLHIEGQEVECDHVAFRLVDDPLTELVVGVVVRVVR